MFAVAALFALIASAATTRPLEKLAPPAYEHYAAVQSPLATVTVSESGIRVPIVLGVMSRCPDALLCESLFDGVLQQTWGIVDINLSFIGTVNASDAEYGVMCKHGPRECAGNVHELCAIRLANSQQDWWEFLQCLNYEGLDSVGDKTLAARCAGIASIPWEDYQVNGTSRSGVKSCVEGQEGKDLLKKSVKQTKALGITKSCTIMISGTQRCVHDGTWQNCETGHTVEELVDYIRDEHKRLQNNGSTTDLVQQLSNPSS